MKVKNWKYKDEFHVILCTPIGTFHGKSRIHKIDKTAPAAYFGYEIAETRAYIKYLKQKKRNYQQRLIGLEDFSTRFNEDISMKAYRRMYKDLNNRIEEIEFKIQDSAAAIKTAIDAADKNRQNYEKNKNRKKSHDTMAAIMNSMDKDS